MARHCQKVIKRGVTIVFSGIEYINWAISNQTSLPSPYNHTVTISSIVALVNILVDILTGLFEIERTGMFSVLYLLEVR